MTDMDYREEYEEECIFEDGELFDLDGYDYFCPGDDEILTSDELVDNYLYHNSLSLQ